MYVWVYFCCLICPEIHRLWIRLALQRHSVACACPAHSACDSRNCLIRLCRRARSLSLNHLACHFRTILPLLCRRQSIGGLSRAASVVWKFLSRMFSDQCRRRSHRGYICHRHHGSSILWTLVISSSSGLWPRRVRCRSVVWSQRRTRWSLVLWYFGFGSRLWILVIHYCIGSQTYDDCFLNFWRKSRYRLFFRNIISRVDRGLLVSIQICSLVAPRKLSHRYPSTWAPFEASKNYFTTTHVAGRDFGCSLSLNWNYMDSDL